jgi:hypothetical protein
VEEIVAIHLWSKSTTDQSLIIISEGLCRAQVASKNNYFIKRMYQLYFLVVAKQVELNPNAIPCGRPQIMWLQVVQFEVDGSVCCSCEFLKGLILCADISWLFFTSWMNQWWMYTREELSVSILGSKCMLE